MRGCGYKVQFAVVVDRECGAEIFCYENAIPFIRIEERDQQIFSGKAAEWLYEIQKVDWTALFFSRLVHHVLYSRALCVNFHPSLLPAFPGFGALKNSLNSGVKFFGATAHIVDHSIDGGRILAQVIAPIMIGYSIEILQRISFAQKLYLLLIICENSCTENLDSFLEKIEKSAVCNYSHYAYPKIRNPELQLAFEAFIASEGIPWPQKTHE